MPAARGVDLIDFTWRYGLAVAVTMLAALVHGTMAGVLGSSLYLVFYPAVVAAAAFGGMGPGLLATIGAGLCVNLLFDPTPGRLDLYNPAVLMRQAIFLAGGIGISVVAGMKRAGQIRERLQAEPLRESEEQFRTIAENVRAAFGILQGERFVYANPYFAQLSGYSVEELLSMDFLQVVHPDFRPVVVDRARRRQRGESVPGNYELMILTKNGQTRWIDYSGARIEYEGRPAIIGAGLDITERKRAEEALRQGELRLRRSQEIAHLGSWELDVANNHLWWSDEVYRIFGLRPQEFSATYEAFLEAVHPEDRAAVDAAYSGSLREGRDTYEIEHRVVRKPTGEIRIVYEKCEHIRDESGQIIRSVGMVHDITERRRAEAAVAESRKRLAGVVDSAMDAIITIDEQQRIVLFNPAAQKMFRCPAAEAIGNSIDQFIPQRFREVHREHIRDFARTGNTARAMGHLRPLSALRADGEEFPIEASISQVDVDGHKLFSVILRDITERKEAEEKLAESERKHRIVADNTYAWEFWIGPDGRFLYNSPSCRRITGYNAEEFIADPGLFDRIIHPDDRALYAEHRGSGHGACATEEAEFRIVRRDGTVRWMVHACVPIYDADGRFMGIRGSNRDITERKQEEEELAAAKAVAEKASAAKDHFLAVLSHELRTPLAPVLTAVAMLEQEPRCDQTMREMLEMVRRNVEMEARLIDDLLDMTRITRGKVELHKKPVRLCDVVRQAVEVCKADLEAKRLHFGVDMGPDAPYLVHADVARLQQVFWNLLKNAVKFTPRGGCVGIRCRRDGDGHVMAEVNDSGMGIEPEDLSRIFSAFEQAGRTTTRQFGGLGLGLSISKVLVEMHGGTITAHSEGKGKGASFRVKLPIISPESKVLSPESKPALSTQDSALSTQRPLRILLVEDHGDTAKMMRQLLMMDGHEVKVAADVATALEAAGNYTFDLILSDLGLPDASGLDLMRELRARGITVSGIALSGYGQEQDIQRSHEAGFTAHLTKPISPERLTEVIAEVTRKPERI